VRQVGYLQELNRDAGQQNIKFCNDKHLVYGHLRNQKQNDLSNQYVLNDPMAMHRFFIMRNATRKLHIRV
jgi:hypothetical protein